MDVMKDLDIRNFATVASVSDSDHVVVSLFSGKSGKMKVGLFRDAVSKGIAPSISPDGYWLVGELNTGVLAEGKTPVLRKGEDGIEIKYANEGDEHWHILVPFSDLKLMFEDLKPEQIDEIRLKYEDLTEEQIQELQKPASDAMNILTEALENQMLAIEISEYGEMVLTVGEQNTEFSDGYISEEGEVTLEFNYE